MSEAHGNLGQTTRQRTKSFAGETSAVSSVELIPIDRIKEDNPRKKFTELDDLAASIESVGLLEPIVVRKRPDGYELIAGGRRMRAFKKLGKDTIPAIVQDADFLKDDATRDAAKLIENIQRENLLPAEFANAVAALLSKGGWTQATIAEKLGKSKSQISKAVKVAEYLNENPKHAIATDLEALYQAAIRTKESDERPRKPPKRNRNTKVSPAKLDPFKSFQTALVSVREAFQSLKGDDRKRAIKALNDLAKLGS